MAALADWGLTHRPGSRRLRARVQALRDGGPELLANLMDERRGIHLGIPPPNPHAPRASERLQAAYEAALRG